MATQYSKPAIEFQRGLAPGMQFAFNYDSVDERQRNWFRAIYGDGEIVVREIVKQIANPDDCLYSAVAANGHAFECRAWWLRKCCRKVERPSS